MPSKFDKPFGAGLPEPEAQAKYGRSAEVLRYAEKLRVQRDAKALVDAEYSAGLADAAIGALMVDGGTFVFDIPDGIPCLWGDGQAVAWAEGEALIIAGPPGVGKTTIAHQVVEAMISLFGGRVLDLDVPALPEGGKILYLACDRPGQIARAMRRRLKDHDRADVARKLIIWRGPPPGDFAKDTDLLTRLCQTAGASVVIIDSLKDVALGLSEDATGAGLNQSRQKALAAGIQVMELHHLVKRGPDGAAPTKLADLYGSAWISAGAGSILLVWGEAGDPIVKVAHLKQPAHEVGPLTVMHDHETGQSHVQHAIRAEDLAGGYNGGITAAKLAERMFDTDRPTANQVEKARRKLDAAVRAGTLARVEGERGGGKDRTPTKYLPVKQDDEMSEKAITQAITGAA